MNHRNTIRGVVFLGFAITSLVCGAQGDPAKQMSQARTYEELQKALLEGRHVSATFHFKQCRSNGKEGPDIQAGLPVQAFMIDGGHIAFSDTHPTVLAASSDLISEFIRYTVRNTGEVDVSAYVIKPGATTATLAMEQTCRIGSGANFTW